MKKVFFISRDANWQLYRNEVLTYLGKNKDIEIEVLTTGELKPYITENTNLKYKVFKNLFNNKQKINFFPGAIRYLIKNRPGCVIGQNGALNLTEYFALLVCKIIGVKFVWWTRAYEHKPLNNNILRKLRQGYVNIFLRMANAIIVYSKIGYDFLISIGVPGERIFLALNTLDTKRLSGIRNELKLNFNRNQFIENEFRGCSENSKFILFVGRVNKFKKVHNLISAMSEIHKNNPDIHLIVIGEGSELQKCQELSSSLKLNSVIHFKGAIYEENEVNKYFMLSDVYSIPGSVGLGIVHAFSFGLPVVTEKLDYHSAEIQYLKDGENGVFVEEENTKMLAGVLSDLLSDEDRRRELSENAIKTIEYEASIDKMVETYYQALLPI